MSYPHLLDSIAPLADLPNADRIYEVCKDRWVGYPKAKEALQKMGDLLNHPKISRMPNLLLIASTNNGKSRVLERFAKMHEASDNLGGEAACVPVILIEAPKTPDEKRLYFQILEKINARYSATSDKDKLAKNVAEKIQKLGTKMLIIDEFHNVLQASPLKQRQFLVVIKSMCNELGISMVCAGTEDVVHAMQTDPQLANRFPPFILPRWRSGQEYRKFLASYEKVLPLRLPSGLSGEMLAHQVWAMSEGTVGETIDLLKKAAMWAIEKGTEVIDAGALDACGYTPPAKRKNVLREE